VEYFSAEIPHLQQGSAIDDGEGVDMGAMISGQRFSHLEGLIKDAVKQGARLIHGGSRYHHPKYPRGFYFQPTLLVDVTNDMAIANEELFAPVALFMRVETIDEAIEIANATIYGLGGSVFGSKNSDVERVLQGVETVGLAVNDFATFYVCQLPFGGTKGSGYGRFMGVEGLRGLCNQKVSQFRHFSYLLECLSRPLSVTSTYYYSARCRLSHYQCRKVLEVRTWLDVPCVWNEYEGSVWWFV
jgi:acyl-CoA reductase-like NAD-dependent aldehyde dehydrogenase